ncbi:MAG TPA: MobF family relaxase [Solirubrobacteraceae bacterium]|jgi:conjugative relaxase-like TrwC/TraI family protein|nr:MobF family relaxase [Solirubrobacteraceae bacterium]
MLSIGKIALGQHRYYEQQVAHGGDDYYSGRGEAPGEWIGAGARALGLSGRVNAEQFSALIAGLDPRDPRVRLRASEHDPRVAALDLTFSAPKSISVLFAVAPEAISGTLAACHEEAVRAALEYLEDTAVSVRRGHGGTRVERAGGLIAAAYRHRMSRALDPQLHTHLVAANLARGRDGRFTALHGTALYRAAKTAGYLYQAHLRALVSDRLGLEWAEVHKGAAELAPVPSQVIAHFSKRRQKMQREADAGGIGLGSRAAGESAALATRERKQYGIDTHTWREEVRARAGELGLGRAEVSEMIHAGRERLDHGSLERGAVDERSLGDHLASANGLTARCNTFDQRPVLQEFAAAAGQGALVGEVRGLAERFEEREDVLATEEGELTTTELVACERRLIAAAIGRARESTCLVEPALAERALAAAGQPLTAEQATAVRTAVTTGHGVTVIQALAGTGKTYTAGALRAVYERAGYQVLGVAPTGRAARELTEQAGIPARTLDQLLIDHEQLGDTLPRGCVVILDEAGMAATRPSARLLQGAEHARAKVIAIGDPGQLSSVQAGGWLGAVGRAVGAVRLTEVMRQRDPAERRALGALHSQLPRVYLQWATRTGRIDTFSDQSTACQQALDEWERAMRLLGRPQAVMIARDNDTRAALNDGARELLAGHGALGPERVYDGVPVAVGDRVICRHNDRRLDVDNGTRGTVHDLDANRIVMHTDSGVLRELPAAYVADHVEHAYALTGHGMQGATIEAAFVIAAPRDLTAGWSYTALSRARGTTRLLIHDHEFSGERGEFAPTDHAPAGDRDEILARVQRQMLQRDDEDLAIEQLPAAIEPLREQLAALPTRQLQRSEDLDARATALEAQRTQLLERLRKLPEPRRRFGRAHDAHAVQRVNLRSALRMAEDELDSVRGRRDLAHREILDPAQIRVERDRLERKIDTLTQQRAANHRGRVRDVPQPDLDLDVGF